MIIKSRSDIEIDVGISVLFSRSNSKGLIPADLSAPNPFDFRTDPLTEYPFSTSFFPSSKPSHPHPIIVADKSLFSMGAKVRMINFVL